MNLEDLQPGDVIYAAEVITNDGSITWAAEDALLADAGSRGMLINVGHLEEDPEQMLYLVSFETASGELGPQIACWPEELSAQPLNVN